MNLLIHASGYLLSPWQGSELTEMRIAQREDESIKLGKVPDCTWEPSTKDFMAAGRASGGSSAAPNVAGMIEVIGDQKVESIKELRIIEELRIIGHSNRKVFSLAGSIRCDNVYFDIEPAIIGDSQTFKAAIPKCRDVQDRLTRDAKVILLGCHGGSGTQDLLDLLGHAFLRTVAASRTK
jgi:hypothetical protein